jgi:hypothetical protein
MKAFGQIICVKKGDYFLKRCRHVYNFQYIVIRFNDKIKHLIIIRLKGVVGVGHIHVFDLSSQYALLAQVPLQGGPPAADLAAHAVVRTHQLVVLIEANEE